MSWHTYAHTGTQHTCARMQTHTHTPVKMWPGLAQPLKMYLISAQHPE